LVQLQKSQVVHGSPVQTHSASRAGGSAALCRNLYCSSVCTPFCRSAHVALLPLRQNLEQERAAQAEEQQKDDPRKKEEEEHRLRLKKATEKFFASGLRKFWLRSFFAEDNLAMEQS